VSLRTTLEVELNVLKKNRDPRNLLKPAWDFLREDKGLPTVKVVVASLVLFVSMDLAALLTPQEDTWNGQQKLFALGIIAAIRMVSVLASAIGERGNRSPD